MACNIAGLCLVAFASASIVVSREPRFAIFEPVRLINLRSDRFPATKFQLHPKRDEWRRA